MAAKLKTLVESRAFANVILGLIVFAAVIVGIETYPGVMDRHGKLLHTIDKIIIWLFALEAALKMSAGGKKWYRYFTDPWNIFDFTIVVVCFLPVNAQYAQVLRLARVLRALRLISAIPKLQLLVGSLLKSLPSMCYVGLLLMVMFYVYAVLGVFLFRENDPVHFRNLELSMLSLFRVVTLEDWTDVMYIQMYGSANYPFSEQDLARYEFNSNAQPFIGAFYFVSFVALGTMIMLNLFIGVIIQSMDEAQAEAEQAKRRKHIEDTGHISVGDEMALIQKQLKALADDLERLQKRADKE
ncbi:ion transporter [Algisphaera agarilytica]|uniref:Voltage-gated sodium channel n=1 Tax=Algisphaera agarilytica TaxID=1385975 RepID=A0A7X0H5A9_9BACT|nr:ion transporter [Algisphaera agarilytica]MBB6429563.1 voltage-gated sodium channel [Algisphaera agarilytica]